MGLRKDIGDLQIFLDRRSIEDYFPSLMFCFLSFLFLFFDCFCFVLFVFLFKARFLCVALEPDLELSL